MAREKEEDGGGSGGIVQYYYTECRRSKGSSLFLPLILLRSFFWRPPFCPALIAALFLVPPFQMQSGGYKQRNRRRGGGCSLQNFPVNTTTESFLSSLAIPFSPSCSFCSGAIFWHLPSSLRSWPGGESMKGIRYYYTACLPPAYRKGGRSSSLIGSQFFWAAWNGGSGVEKACEIMGSPRTLALSVEAEEDRGSISLPRPWA